MTAYGRTSEYAQICLTCSRTSVGTTPCSGGRACITLDTDSMILARSAFYHTTITLSVKILGWCNTRTGMFPANARMSPNDAIWGANCVRLASQSCFSAVAATKESAGSPRVVETYATICRRRTESCVANQVEYSPRKTHKDRFIQPIC